MIDEVHLRSVKKRMAGNKCPQCGRTAEGGTALDDRADLRDPKPGDVAVCVYCGALNRYGPDLTLCKIDRAERRRLLRKDPRLKELVYMASWLAHETRREWN